MQTLQITPKCNFWIFFLAKSRWTGTLDATKPPPTCLQLLKDTPKQLQDPEKIVGTDDCLVLNVYVPLKDNQKVLDQKIPVMIWIHGGLLIFQSAVCLHFTVWKFQDFSVTQILREINFRDFRSAKSAILTHLEALNIDFYEFWYFLKDKIYQINKIQSP